MFDCIAINAYPIEFLIIRATNLSNPCLNAAISHKYLGRISDSVVAVRSGMQNPYWNVGIPKRGQYLSPGYYHGTQYNL